MLKLFLTGIAVSAIIEVEGQFNSFISRKWHFNSLPSAQDDYQKEFTFRKLRANERSFNQDDYSHGSPYLLNGYTLRYQPSALKQRLFWHKFPVKQQEPPPVTTMEPDENPTETEEPPIMTTMGTETSSEPMTELPSSEMPPVMNMTTRKPTKRPTLKPSTTQTTIMKPAIRPPLQLGSKLKNLLLFGSPLQANIISKQPTAPKPKGKGFLNLFEVIKFENTKCSVTMSDVRTLDGVCFHDFECKSLGGISTEPCAEGVGACCICCGDTTNQAIAYFESPNYPNPVREMMMCVLVVNLRKNVQQLRLDFLMFELSRPTDGDCEDDQFIVSGQNLNFYVPVLCGINTGQHLYIHVGDSSEMKVYLTIVAKTVTGGRSFNIRVAQLEDNLAPENCLQYYTEPQGVLKSFNYDVEGQIVDNKEATYLNNLNYAICLPRLKDICSVVYTAEQFGDNPLDFQILNKDDDENDLVPDGQAGAGIFNCPDDFIGINQVRLCGERFNDGTEIEDYTVNALVRDIQAGPIVLPVKSDAEYVGRGFRLAYRQEACT